MSPVVLREGGFRFQFTSQDRDHHPHDSHVHAVKRGRGEARFTLWEPIEAKRNRGLSDRDISKGEGIISANLDYMLE